MGADSTLIFFGIRFETSDEEAKALQERTDPRIVRARKANLAHWWGNFSVNEYTVASQFFVGTLLATIGHEGRYEFRITEQAMSELIQRTQRQLIEAGFSEEPSLFVQFEPDY